MSPQAFYFSCLATLVLQVSASFSSSLSTRHLKIATKEILPYVYIHRNGDGSILNVTGPVAGITEWLSRRHNFTYEYLEPLDRSFGSKVNGEWNGMIRMAQDHQVDLVAAPLTPTYARSEAVDFTMSFFEEPLGIVIPAPIEGDKTAAIIKPFTAEVWVLTILAMLAVALALWVLTKVTWTMFRGRDTTGNYRTELSFTPHFLFCFGVLSLQARMCTAPNHTTRVVAAAWCLIAVVLVNLYTGCLISYITIPKLYPLVNSIEDLATSNKLELLIFKSTFFETVLLEAESGPYKLLGDSLLRNPENRMEFGIEAFNRVLRGGSALIVEKSLLETRIEDDLRSSGSCRASLVKGEFHVTSEAFATPKGSPYTVELSKDIIWLRETGLIQYWIKKHWPKENRCTTSKKESINPGALKLRNLAGSFILLSVGIVLALTAFLAELLIHCYNNRPAMFRKKYQCSRKRNVK